MASAKKLNAEKANKRHFEKFVELLEEFSNFRACFNGETVPGYDVLMYDADWNKIVKELNSVDSYKQTQGDWQIVSYLISYFLYF